MQVVKALLNSDDEDLTEEEEAQKAEEILIETPMDEELIKEIKKRR